jgi:hypothetical protein
MLRLANVRTRSLVSLGLATLVTSCTVARGAQAEPTSWLAVGGAGATQLNRASSTQSVAGALTYSVGVGTTPLAPVVVGGIFRGQTYFGLGTDVGLAIRAATGGFARGEWGLALDAGAAWRPWKTSATSDYGAWPLQFVLTGGAPWGFQIALGTELSSVSGGTPARGFFAALEIDLLRLTVMRQGETEHWWPNPTHAGEPPAPPPSDAP